MKENDNDVLYRQASVAWIKCRRNPKYLSNVAFPADRLPAEAVRRLDDQRRRRPDPGRQRRHQCHRNADQHRLHRGEQHAVDLGARIHQPETPGRLRPRDAGRQRRLRRNHRINRAAGRLRQRGEPANQRAADHVDRRRIQSPRRNASRQRREEPGAAGEPEATAGGELRLRSASPDRLQV